MECPVCEEPLIVVEREKIELDFCPRCHGLWFDAGELALLAEMLHRTLTPARGDALEKAVTDEKPYPCPRCGRRMEKFNLGSAPRVRVDRCRAGHGLWFDHGELGSLMSQMPVKPGSRPEALLRFMGETFVPGAAAPERNSASNVAKEGEEER